MVVGPTVVCVLSVTAGAAYLLAVPDAQPVTVSKTARVTARSTSVASSRLPPSVVAQEPPSAL